MEKDELNPDGQEQQPEETVEVVTPPVSGDPLDDIQDVDALRATARLLPGFGEDQVAKLSEMESADEVRAEIKKVRAISRRKSSKPTPEPEKVEEEKPKSEFVTKKDLAKVATNDAKALVSDEVLEVWDDLMSIPLGGYDLLDSRSIAANMVERFAIHSARNPEADTKPDTSDLTASAVKAGTAQGVKPKAKPVEPPNFRLPKQPGEWYE